MKPFFTSLKRSLKAIVALLLCASCSVSVPRSTVYFVNEETKAPDLWPSITDETDTYSLSLTALGNIDDALLFEVGVINKSQDSLVIDPRSWVMFPTKSAAENWVVLDTVSALEAEQIVQVYDGLATKMKKARNNERAIIVAAGVVLVVGVILLANLDKDTDDDEDKKDEKKYVRKPHHSHVIINNPINLAFNARPPIRAQRGLSENQRIANLQNEAERYETASLDPILIGPQDQVYFDIYFPKPDTLNDFQLQWLLNNELLYWHFIHVQDEMKKEEMIGIPSGL